MAKKPVIAPRKPRTDSTAAKKFLASVPDEDQGDEVAPTEAPVAEVRQLKVERSDVEPSDGSNQASAKGAGQGDAKQPSASPKARKRVFTRVRDGRQVRQTTVYLDVALAKQLAYHCVDTDLDQSQVISAALREYLSAQ